MLEALTPTRTTHLFAPLHDALLVLLRGLSAADWHRPTVAGTWTVHDVVAHLLDIDLRRLSADRDAHQMNSAPDDRPFDLVSFVNELNRSGVDYARRLSPRVMIDLLTMTGAAVARHFHSLDPEGEARWAVSWAGESHSANWMDIGRDYTERWHHQQQIRDAVGVPRQLETSWLMPLFDLSVRVLPVAYRNTVADEGTTITLDVSSPDQPMAWTVVRHREDWRVMRGRPLRSVTTVRADADLAWRIFYKALSVEGRARIVVEGDDALAEPLFGARSIVTAG